MARDSAVAVTEQHQDSSVPVVPSSPVSTSCDGVSVAVVVVVLLLASFSVPDAETEMYAHSATPGIDDTVSEGIPLVDVAPVFSCSCWLLPEGALLSRLHSVVELPRDKLRTEPPFSVAELIAAAPAVAVAVAFVVASHPHSLLLVHCYPACQICRLMVLVDHCYWKHSSSQFLLLF